MRKPSIRLTALLLAASLLLSLAACGQEEAKATTMHLKRAEGTVAVSDDTGEDVPLLEGLGLYSGYGVDTRSASFAWIDLDSVKLTKMDEDSEIAIRKEDKLLEIEVKSGALFFNVTEPLAEDETMTIRTSTMMVGIRGTCGWVEVPGDGTMKLFLLEGKVSCETGEEKRTVRAGEAAIMVEDGEITVEPFAVADIPEFVMEEVKEDDGLVEAILNDAGLDVLNPMTPEMLAMEQYRAILAQAEAYFDDDTDYGDMEVTISYKYTLALMRAGSPLPALVLEQETYGDYWGDMCTALVFQYDPDSGTVILADDSLVEGVASAGGYRGTLALSGDGIGILETSWSSGTGMGTIRLATMSGNELQWSTLFDGMVIGDTRPAIPSIPITWYDAADLSGLDNWTPAEPGQPSGNAGPETAALARAAYEGVLERYRDAMQNALPYDEYGENWEQMSRNHESNAASYPDLGPAFLDYCTSDSRQSPLYYTYHDLDGNGTDELFIGVDWDIGSIVLLEVHAFNGTEAVKLSSPGFDPEFGVYFSVLSGDGLLIDQRGNGGMTSGIVYRLAGDGYSLESVTDSGIPAGAVASELDLSAHGGYLVGQLEWAPLGSDGGPASEAADGSLPTDGDRLVLLGTVNTYSGAELLDLQGAQDPNPGQWSETGKTFRVIVLDPGQTVTARNGDGQGSHAGEAMLIDVTNSQGLEQYNGQSVTFSIDPNDTWWPSDTSLPLGQPRTDDVHILR